MWRVCLWVEYSCEWRCGESACELKCGESACEWSVPVSEGVKSLPVSGVFLWVKVWRVCLWVKVWRVCLWLKSVHVSGGVKSVHVSGGVKSVHVSGGVESVSVSKNQSANYSVRGGLFAALCYIHLKRFWCLVLGLPWWVTVYSCRRSSLAFGHILPTDLWGWGGGGWREGFGDGLRNLVRM